MYFAGVAQFWETIQPFGGNQINVGAVFVGSSPQNFYPLKIAINGVPCQLQQI